MYEFKMQLLYNEEEFYYLERELLRFMLTLPLHILDIIGARLESNALICSGDVPADARLVILLSSNVKELSIGAKTKKF